MLCWKRKIGLQKDYNFNLRCFCVYLFVIRFLVISNVVIEMVVFCTDLLKCASKLTVYICFSVHLPKEGWVSIPNKQNIKKYGWKRQVSLASHLLFLFQFQVQNVNSSYWQPYSSFNTSSKNLVLDQSSVTQLIFFYVLINCFLKGAQSRLNGLKSLAKLFNFVVFHSVSIFSILNHPLSFMLCYNLFGVFLSL